jgi:hypothetical protein
MGSASGTSPGLLAGTFNLPLQFDSYFIATASAPNQPPLANSLGVLPSGLLAFGGQVTTTFTLPAGTSPALAGLTLNHAYVMLDSFGVTMASEAVSLHLVP